MDGWTDGTVVSLRHLSLIPVSIALSDLVEISMSSGASRVQGARVVNSSILLLTWLLVSKQNNQQTHDILYLSMLSMNDDDASKLQNQE